jgi:hypothetical protein
VAGARGTIQIHFLKAFSCPFLRPNDDSGRRGRVTEISMTEELLDAEWDRYMRGCVLGRARSEDRSRKRWKEGDKVWGKRKADVLPREPASTSDTTAPIGKIRSHIRKTRNMKLELVERIKLPLEPKNGETKRGGKVPALLRIENAAMPCRIHPRCILETMRIHKEKQKTIF